MDHTEFVKLHGECNTARLEYFGEAELTSALLGNCKPDPLGFKDRVALATQGIAENQAYLIYSGLRSLLLDAARLGYG